MGRDPPVPPASRAGTRSRRFQWSAPPIPCRCCRNTARYSMSLTSNPICNKLYDAAVESAPPNAITPTQTACDQLLFFSSLVSRFLGIFCFVLFGCTLPTASLSRSLPAILFSSLEHPPKDSVQNSENLRWRCLNDDEGGGKKTQNTRPLAVPCVSDDGAIAYAFLVFLLWGVYFFVLSFLHLDEALPLRDVPVFSNRASLWAARVHYPCSRTGRRNRR